MIEALQSLFWITLFPGFLFTTSAGLVMSWVVRNVSALVQWRVGPPFAQPFWDIAKLLGKELLIPEDANRAVFVAAPLVGLAAVTVLSTMLWRAAFAPQLLFIGDIVVAIYFMVLVSLALILGASASASPHAAVGTAREMKMVMAYELPLILSFVVVIIKTDGQLSLAAIAGHTSALSISGALAFVVSLLAVQAKVGFVPFDIAEAETELAGGVLMEYSGPLLAIWKITQAMMLVAMPLFLITMFLGGFGSGGIELVWGVVKYVLILVVMILIKNTNPRVRIDQAMKFFWVYCGIALTIAVVLAMVGNVYGIGWL